MIKATIGLIILAVVVAVWLLRTGVRVGRDAYDAATGAGIFPPLGKGANLRHQATQLTQALLERTNRALGANVDIEREARRLVDTYYSLRPSFFSGHYRQDPHPLSLAAAALALEISQTRSDPRMPLPFALMLIMSELEQRGHLYAFNALDETLLKEAAKTAFLVAEAAEQEVSKSGLQDFVNSAMATRPAAAPAPAPAPAPQPTAPVPAAAVTADSDTTGLWIFALGLVTFVVVVVVVAIASSRQPQTTPNSAIPPDISPPVSAVAPPPPPPPALPTPELRHFPVLPMVRVMFLADGVVRDVSEKRVHLATQGDRPRSTVAFDYKGVPHVAEFIQLSAPDRFFPAFRLREAVEQVGPGLLETVGADGPVENARVEGNYLAYQPPGAPLCRGTLRVASNRLIEVRVCGAPGPDETLLEQIVSSVERDNPSKDIETDSTEDALNMTFRAIRDQLGSEAKATFIADQRAWIAQKEAACRPVGMLSEEFFVCIDQQVSARLADLRARVAAGLPAESEKDPTESRSAAGSGSSS